MREKNVTQKVVDHFLIDEAGNYRGGFEIGDKYTVEISMECQSSKINFQSVEMKTGMKLKSIYFDSENMNLVFYYSGLITM